MKSYSDLLSYLLFVIKMILLSSIPDFIKVSGTTKITPKKTSRSQHSLMIIGK